MRHRNYRPRRRGQKVILRSKFRFERKKKARQFGFYLLAAAVAGLLLWRGAAVVNEFVYGPEHFRIRSVEISPLKNITQSEIMAMLPFRPGDNIFRVNLSEAAKTLRRYKPELKRITMHRGWKKIVVKAQEREPVACVNAAGERLGIDADNLPFPLRGSWREKNLPELVNGRPDERERLLGFINTFAPNSKELFGKVAGLYVEPVNRVVIELKDGTRIFWGAYEKSELRDKLAKLTQVMDENGSRFGSVDYINLCFFDQGRVIVKPKEALR